MEQFIKILPQIRTEVDHSLSIWKNILINEFKEIIEYIYAKGSAIKPWASPLDYVPILSDLDIHFKLVKNRKIFQNASDPMAKSLEISERYEQNFNKNYPNSLHLPRTQLVTINHLQSLPEYVPPRKQDVRIIYGDPNFPNNPESSKIREIDYNHLIEIKEILENLPMSLIDRSGLDYWVLIRRINWQVSPTPIRLLTQLIEDNPLVIWGWNRTKIITELENQGFEELAYHYKQFYLKGWEAFLAKHQNNQTLRHIIHHGYKVLHSSMQIIERLK
ncbi:MAG: hypothetical protein ACFFFH_05420 [Candidatus Thorarchaeota archaeon]